MESILLIVSQFELWEIVSSSHRRLKIGWIEGRYAKIEIVSFLAWEYCFQRWF
jgi:hypothetical protein